LFAHGAASGEISWEFDTRGESWIVNQVPAMQLLANSRIMP